MGPLLLLIYINCLADAMGVATKVLPADSALWYIYRAIPNCAASINSVIHHPEGGRMVSETAVSFIDQKACFGGGFLVCIFSISRSRNNSLVLFTARSC